ncbi:16S rRNA (cytosine(1402)-N(4))-methyltransferase RsmH [Streptomyces rapamycinicus]|uniref:Ribosomal RNA small subunit methyltransferase H n=2 Tax=Streptomyces rapamycinicus TaxID=1226757 RepID=A0A3L8REN8_STRRN|nr:16S rRNA (cytosine(1402)-N(4))-methyltransferase RsmH [Streptomyces rapamycinicus]MBB4786295.1 16S rRNA (cytosine1402-N4)-methyltransferase [Streptomyces rapamycinicus]RLV78244.1 16S rRNA (cytosine(1402)-N(4))-methyltransferase [Streptomyces rapamycinicus NRRL 5491]UTO66395.1 16S rRNA (cytosine(1402)-N(4))-methyltransferase RsmH [Streptomyces rapamycinicus]UTP34349.1 16S rRNA (cytosine(1402)-N(4))-methyltransferase RsmH [Streptomyces rapamycinicus NRRL 5491]
MSSNALHVPVMLQRCLDMLAPALAQPGAVAVDCTLGLGGHSEALLRDFPEARLIALDRDPSALRLAGERLAPYGDRATLVHAVYDELPEVLDRLGVPRVQGILFDLGVSSMQLDEAGRGFAYAQDAPLDMRMDQTTGVSAAEVLNTYPPGDLVRILRTYGEEKFARKIVDAVVRERAKEPFTNSARLVELIRDALPQAAKRTGGNPAKRTFQALRIEVNGEIAVLERAIPAAVRALAVGGRIAVLSYHSLEDRLVKQVLAAGAGNTAPPGLPVIPEQYQPRLKLLTRGAELPTEQEIAENRRAAPARFRGAERIREEVAP